MSRVYFGVGLTTLATLLLELLLTRIFSVTLYYHFAFMVISLALFGIGLSGVVLYLRPRAFPEERLRGLLAAYGRRFALATVVSLVYVVNHALSTPIEATQLSRFTWQNFFELAFLYLFAALPFYFGGMVVSLALFHLRRRVATLYAFDLAGASLACLLLDPLLRLLGGPSAVILTAIIAACAALLFDGEAERWRPSRKSLVLLASLALLLGVNLRAEIVKVGSFKGVHEDLLVFQKWNALSRIEVQEVKPLPPSMTIDGMAQTTIYSLRTKEVFSQHQGVTALVHVIRTRGRVLIIGPGGGVDVLAALQAGHAQITLAEINPIIVNDVMLGRYRDYSGNLYGQPQVRPVIAEGRSFVRRSEERFDVIQASLVDTWAATAAGAFALTENFLYTVDAFEDYLAHLNDSGILTMSRWVDSQSMEFVRLCALARAALERQGVQQPFRHVFAASQGRLGTLLVKRSPFTDGEFDELERTCRERNFTVLYSPRGRYENASAIVLGPGRPDKFFAEFPIDVRPVYDDRPFFFYGVKPERLLSSLFGTGPVMLNNYSAVVLPALLGLVALLVLGGILVPLWFGARRSLAGTTASKLRDLSFFMGIGVGYILLEIAFLNRFTLYLGHPTHSLRVVLFSLLLFSGLGSLLSGRAKTPRGLLIQLGLAAAGVVAVAGLYLLLLPPLLRETMGWSFGARVGLSVLLVALPGWLMGMMLPTGIRLVTGRHQEIIPWAWGLNGAASVLGSVLAMFLAVHVGFSAMLAAGGLLYLLAVLAGLRRPAVP